MAKIDFLVPESKQVWDHIETAAARSHYDARRAFEDFLSLTVCALSGGQMEEQYLQTAKQYSNGEPGRRAIDAFPAALAVLIETMEQTRQDILGDIFQGAITHGQNGQFFTPKHVCDLMACITIDPESRNVLDPCCGSGRLLLAAADLSPWAEFYGQDIDIRCVQMTAINLAMRNLYGWVIQGNSLSNEQLLIYRTGFCGKGVIAEVTPRKVPEPVMEIVTKVQSAGRQLMMF
ncbi:MAG: N-6 DNA methylase [Thermoguttaceae bacterium]